MCQTLCPSVVIAGAFILVFCTEYRLRDLVLVQGKMFLLQTHEKRISHYLNGGTGLGK